MAGRGGDGACRLGRSVKTGGADEDGDLRGRAELGTLGSGAVSACGGGGEGEWEWGAEEEEGVSVVVARNAPINKVQNDDSVDFVIGATCRVR